LACCQNGIIGAQSVLRFIGQICTFGDVVDIHVVKVVRKKRWKVALTESLSLEARLAALWLYPVDGAKSKYPHDDLEHLEKLISVRFICAQS